jgi:hypothetical protein
MTNIAVSEKVWTELNQRKKPGDSFDDVLRRELGLAAEAPATDPVDAVAAAINIGRTDVAVEANRELVRVATRWLRDRDGSIRKGAAPLAEWQQVDTHPQAPRSEKTLWNDVIVVAWRRSDLVSDTDRTFAWVGAES